MTISSGGDVLGQSNSYEPADADTIINSAEAILSYRCRQGVKILRDPHLLFRFLRMRLGSQPQPVFAVFFLDRKQRLIRFSELARGENDQVRVHPKEVVRDALACGCEQILCVRSDPRGDPVPTPQDVDDAKRVNRALELLAIPLLDYLIVGRSISSLRRRGVL
ncbi:MAG: JAB domain-containing protein [Gammaproteobacteria bacterium]